MFGRAFTDILSGYRVFSRRFVKSFPILSGGFEIETELTIHALELELPVAEVATPYYSRPSGSASKLNTWRDGFRILWTVLKLYRAERPLSFFGAFGVALAIMSIGLAIPIVITYVQEGVVPRLPTAVLSTGLMLLAFLSIACGLDPRHRHARPARSQASSPISRCARRAKNGGGAEAMREIVRTNDAVLISAIEALLKGAHITTWSSIRISACSKARSAFSRAASWSATMIVDAARRLLEEAGFGRELRRDGR